MFKHEEDKMLSRETIMEDIKKAMKSGDTLRKNVLRMLLSDIKYAQAAVDVHKDLDEKALMKVIMSYHKKLKKSYEEFPEGDKKAEILSEIKIIEEYLPKKISEAELDKTIEKVFTENESRNFGVLMKSVLAIVGNTADAKEVSAKIKKRLEA